MAATTARSRPSVPPECVIIKESLEIGVTEEDFENELEQALEEKANIIVIEPATLGEETARWIKVGNCLHKTSVISGSVCIIGQCLDNQREYIYFSVGLISVVCAGVYAISWQSDPCCKYQVEDDVPKLESLLTSLSSTAPVVLVRKDDSRRKKLHNFVSLVSGLFCVWKIYKWITS